MNIKKLFEMQKVLDERIYKEHDLRNKYTKERLIINRILALIVETAECANEHREFKFWSKDRKPRTEIDVICSVCNGTGDMNYEMVQEDAEGNGGHEYIDCTECECSGLDGTKNPLLEEYVDGLHFVLSLGLELDYEDMGYFKWHKQKAQTISGQFITVTKWAAAMLEDDYYFELFHAYIHLGVMLGFTWEQIEQAYMNKNQVNHQRQDNGY